MNEITYVRMDDSEALYLNGELYDYASKLHIYDLLGLLQNMGIVDKAVQINHETKPEKFLFPIQLKDLK